LKAKLKIFSDARKKWMRSIGCQQRLQWLVFSYLILDVKNTGNKHQPNFWGLT
jgi:hypothetical protein